MAAMGNVRAHVVHVRREVAEPLRLRHQDRHHPLRPQQTHLQHVQYVDCITDTFMYYT